MALSGITIPDLEDSNEEDLHSTRISELAPQYQKK